MPATDVDIPFVGGLDEQTERRILPFGRLRSCVNVTFDLDGRLSKRNGFEALTMTSLAAGSVVPLIVRPTAWRDEQLLLSEWRPYTYIPSADRWDSASSTTKANICSRVKQSAVIRQPAFTVEEVGVATVGGYTLYAWIDDGLGLGIRIIHEATQAEVYLSAGLNSTASKLRCWSFGTHLYAGFIDATPAPDALKVYSYDTAAPGTAPAVTTEIASIHADNIWDVAVSSEAGEEIVILWKDSITGDMELGTWSEALAAVSAVTLGVGTNATACGVWAGDVVYVAWWDDTAETIEGAYAPLDLASVTASTTIASSIASDPSPLVVGYRSATSAWVYWCEEYTAATVAQPTTAYNYVTNAGAVGTPGDFEGFKIASKPFKYKIGGLDPYQLYIWGAYDNATETSLQKQYVMLDVTQDPHIPLARVNYRDARGFQESGLASAVAETSTGSFIWAACVTTAGQLNIADPNSDADAYRWDFTSRGRMQTAEFGSLCITGGLTHQWDGTQTNEIGFLQAPDFLETATGVGTLAGTYTYCAIYEQIDHAGGKHRSYPSPEVSETPSTNKVIIKVPYLRNSGRQFGTLTRIVLYRTENGGTIFYELASAVNNLTGATIASFDDDLADATLSSRPALYTTAGEVETYAPPSCDAMVVHADRLFLACGDRVYYSHRSITREAPTFSEVFYVTLPETVTALASLDGALVIFSETRVYLLYGDGPNRMGQDAFENPQLMTTEAGCLDARSVAVSPQGIMFRSKRGIELLPRGGGSVEYVGQWVKTQLATYPDITSAVVDRIKSEVRFTVVDDEDSPTVGRILVWNYRVGQWSTWTAPGYDSACMWGDTYILGVISGGDVFKLGTAWEDPSSAHIPFTVETGDIRLPGIMRYQRLQRINVLGEFRTPHKLTISVAYNGVDTYDDSSTKSWSLVAGMPMRQPYAPPRQKLEAIRVKLTDDSSTAGEGLALIGLGIQVKAKRKASKLGTSTGGVSGATTVGITPSGTASS